MAYTRDHPRTTRTEDLSATMRPARHCCVAGRVLNLSHRGDVVASSGLEVDETADFEIGGPDFRSAGVARVAHGTGQARACIS